MDTGVLKKGLFKSRRADSSRGRIVLGPNCSMAELSRGWAILGPNSTAPAYCRTYNNNNLRSYGQSLRAHWPSTLYRKTNQNTGLVVIPRSKRSWGSLSAEWTLVGSGVDIFAPLPNYYFTFLLITSLENIENKTGPFCSTKIKVVFLMTWSCI